MTAPAGASSSPAGRGGGAASRGARWLFWAGALAVVVLVALSGGGRHMGLPFDPDSTSPDGAHGLVELVEHFGGRVQETGDQPPADADIALAFPGRVDLENTEALREWVRKGHTLVVTEPVKGLTPAFGMGTGSGAAAGGDIRRGDCTVAALARVQSVRVSGPLPVFFDGEGEAGRCFGDDRSSFVVVTTIGRGNLVSIGSGSPFVNANLDEPSNGAFAVSLLAPRPGTRVALLRLPVGSAQSQSVWDQVSTGVKLGLAQLAVAFVAYSLFRGRRLGKPILEPQPTELAGSELVSAVGDLLQQTKSPFKAAAILRSGLRRMMCERFGLPVSTLPEVVADAVAARSGIDIARARNLLLDVPVTTDADLLRLARELDALREEVLHVPTA